MDLTREASVVEDDTAYDNPIVHVSPQNTAMKLELSVNPFTLECQRIIDIVYWLEAREIANVRLIILPRFNVSGADSALSAYFRGAYFSDTPTVNCLDSMKVYEMNPLVPRSWVLSLMDATFDPDHLRVQAGPDHADYSLVQVLAEGKCGRNVGAVEFVTRGARTICERAMGYFQFLLSPGEFMVELTPQDKAHAMRPTRISVASFSRTEHVLEPEGSWHPTSMSPHQIETRAHVLIAPDGHFGEHLTKMTVMSIMKSSTMPVDFWILEKSTSAAFKSAMNDISRRSCRFVRYEWPPWLKVAPGKDRAAAISRVLFLDLFMPLEVERVIALEPGMVVRGDIAELVELDMKDSPCGFIPFPKHTDPHVPGVRFWGRDFSPSKNSSRDFRGGLFVVDLPLWRQAALGEFARRAYNDLVSGSVTLDQIEDQLPSVLHASLRAFQLPEEWGWCPALYTQESLANAKGIGACGSDHASRQKDFEKLKRTVLDWSTVEENVTRLERGRSPI
jgi:hypothetical protein